MKRTTITLPQDLVNELLQVTPAKNKTRAVVCAVQEYVKRRKLETIKSMAENGRWHRAAKA